MMIPDSNIKLNILIPMAGMGSRFSVAGYDRPKPFVDVNGKPMIERVIQNLNYPNTRYILIVRFEHLVNFKDIIDKLKSQYNIEIISIDLITEGTAITALFARHLYNNEIPLIIANSDQLVDSGINGMINDSVQRNLDGSIMVFDDPHGNVKWSFARTNEQNLVEEVQEKKPISRNATVGIYMFSKGKYFLDSAIEMIINNDRVNNEFYTCPVYNYLIKKKLKIGIYEIDKEQMHGLGTPEDLTIYINRNRHD